MLRVRKPKSKIVRPTPVVKRLVNPEPFSGLKRRVKKLAGVKPKSRSVSDIRAKLAPEGGIYLDPNGSLLVMWDECDSFVQVTPDPFTTDEHLVKLRLFAGKRVASYSEPILWADALDIISSTGIPNAVFDCIKMATEQHGFSSLKPS